MPQDSLPQQVGFKRSLLNQSGFVTISNALQWGCRFLSDQAKVTYNLVQSLDWDSQGAGEVWYSRDTLSELRGCPHQTLSWHFRELTHFGLLRAFHRPGTTTVWEIQQPPRIELERAAFIRRCLTEMRHAERPRDLADGAFRRWCRTNRPDLACTLDQMDELAATWRIIRAGRQSVGRRRDGVQVELATLRDRQTKPVKRMAGE